MYSRGDSLEKRITTRRSILKHTYEQPDDEPEPLLTYEYAYNYNRPIRFQRKFSLDPADIEDSIPISGKFRPEMGTERSNSLDAMSSYDIAPLCDDHMNIQYQDSALESETRKSAVLETDIDAQMFDSKWSLDYNSHKMDGREDSSRCATRRNNTASQSQRPEDISEAWPKCTWVLNKTDIHAKIYDSERSLYHNKGFNRLNSTNESANLREQSVSVYAPLRSIPPLWRRHSEGNPLCSFIQTPDCDAPLDTTMAHMRRGEGDIRTLMFTRDISGVHLAEMIVRLFGGQRCDKIRLSDYAGNVVRVDGCLPDNSFDKPYQVEIIPTKHTACKQRCSYTDPLLPHTPPIGTKGCHVGGPILKIPNLQDGKVWNKFTSHCKYTMSETQRRELNSVNFNVLTYTEDYLLYSLYDMFIQWGVVEVLNTDTETLRNFLFNVYLNYNDVPFHNFRHGMCVAQMVFVIANQLRLLHWAGHAHAVSLLVASICHDLDHPGKTNAFQVNVFSDLTVLYNDISVLENHHCAVAFTIMKKRNCNIFHKLTLESFRLYRQGIIRCILATDMSRHNEIMSQFRKLKSPIYVDGVKYRGHHRSALAPGLDRRGRELEIVMMMLIKVADISNEVRPLSMAEPWLDHLLNEFFNQGDDEKEMNLCVTPGMDRDKISKSSSQISFIGYCVVPLYTEVCRKFPKLKKMLTHKAYSAYLYYYMEGRPTKANGSLEENITKELHEKVEKIFKQLDLDYVKDESGDLESGSSSDKSSDNSMLKKPVRWHWTSVFRLTSERSCEREQAIKMRERQSGRDKVRLVESSTKSTKSNGDNSTPSTEMSSTDSDDKKQAAARLRAPVNNDEGEIIEMKEVNLLHRHGAIRRHSDPRSRNILSKIRSLVMPAKEEWEG